MPVEAAPGLAGQVHAEHRVLEGAVQADRAGHGLGGVAQGLRGDDAAEDVGLTHGVVDLAQGSAVGGPQGVDQGVHIGVRSGVGARGSQHVHEGLQRLGHERGGQQTLQLSDEGRGGHGRAPAQNDRARLGPRL